MRASPTILARVPRASEATATITNIQVRATRIERVAAPAFAAVFDAGVLVHPAVGEALLDCHVGAVVVDLFGESAS
jgi:hypothetical protein